ncbi:MAG: glycosyltransferase family 4 protein [bacterium]
MKILHLATEIAGQVSTTARAQRGLGYEAYSLSSPHPFGYDVDIILSGNRFLRYFQRHVVGIYWLEKFDIFHYHGRGTLMFKEADVRWLMLRGKKFFIEFWGSDVRLYEFERQRNKYFVVDNNVGQKRKLQTLQFWSDVTDSVIVADHSIDHILKLYFKNIFHVGQRIEVDHYKPIFPHPGSKVPKIIHAPSAKKTKGTEFVIKAIDKLTSLKLKFEYVEVHGVSHHEAARIYQTADIIVDQLTLGSHGVFACEAMALGKPVVCYILPELVSQYPEGFPIINANPDNLAEVLEELILDPERRYHIGVRSREYAERVHDSRLVARRLIDIYRAKTAC